MSPFEGFSHRIDAYLLIIPGLRSLHLTRLPRREASPGYGPITFRPRRPSNLWRSCRRTGICTPSRPSGGDLSRIRSLAPGLHAGEGADASMLLRLLSSSL